MPLIKITKVHPLDAFYTKTKRNKDSLVGATFRRTERTIESPANCGGNWTFFDQLKIVAHDKPIKDFDMMFCFYAVQFELVEGE